MKIYIKNFISIILCSLCMSAMATDTFIVTYKLSESQKDFSSSHGDIKKAKAQIRKEQMEKLSKEQLATLSKAATAAAMFQVTVTDSRSLATGAHVFTLSEDLDETQTKQFIHNVEQDDNIEFIEEDKEVYAC